ELLRGVVRPHRQNVEVGLDLHDIVEDQAEVLANADVQLDRAAGRAVEAKQTVGLVVLDGDGGLGADFNPIAHILNFALVVGVRDRREDGGCVELLDQLRTPNFRDKPGRYESVGSRADGSKWSRGDGRSRNTRNG